MSIKQVSIGGVVYPLAPLEPEHHDHPSPAFPMAVTPEIARHWLRYNYRNRSQRERGERDYSSDMIAGGFVINASTVSFSRPLAAGEDERVPAGHVCLMDGQHRLKSCIRSGKPFVVYVAYGIDPSVRPTIDTGMKRTFSDALRMAGYKNSTVLAAVAKRVHAWENGDFYLTLKKVASTHSQMIEFTKQHPEVERSAEIAARTRADFDQTTTRDLRQSMAGFMHWRLMRAEPSMAPEFFARLGDGDMLGSRHPIAQLRSRLMRDQAEKKQVQGASRREIPKVADWQQMCYYIRTWNAYLLWAQTPEHRRENLSANFAMLGHSDSERIPDVKTLDDIAKVLRKKELGDNAQQELS